MLIIYTANLPVNKTEVLEPNICYDCDIINNHTLACYTNDSYHEIKTNFPNVEFVKEFPIFKLKLQTSLSYYEKQVLKKLYVLIEKNILIDLVLTNTIDFPI